MFKIKKSSNRALRPVATASQQTPSSGLGVDSKTHGKKKKSLEQEKKKKLAANTMESLSYQMPTSMGPGADLSTNAVSIDLEPMLMGLTPQVESAFFRLYRDIYYFDSVAGSAVDMISQVTFSSEFGLGGISNSKVAQSYEETIQQLNTRTLLPEMSTDHLVLGTHCSSLLYNKKKRVFADLMCHPIEALTVTDLPFYSQDPIINVKFSSQVQAAVGSNSPSVAHLEELVGRPILDKIRSGSLDLDPLTTIYIPRKTFSYTEIGTSYYKRILPWYLIEKNLYRGTLVESARRQRGILHVTLGDGDEWIPQLADMEFFTDLFMNADSDPLGAIIATRSGVSVEEIRQGGDFWKVTDFSDSVMPYKLRALGISEAFLTGDASYNCVAGDTLITTNKGIQRIDNLAKMGEGKVQDLDLVSASRYGKEKTAKWLYQGKAPTLTIDLYKSSSLCGTRRHKILVLAGQTTDWKPLSKICVDDIVAVSTTKLVRKSKLKLNLGFTQKIGLNQHKQINDSLVKKPKYMTTELAYVIGCIVAEGHIQNYCVKMGNTNLDLVNKYVEYYEQVFNFKPSVTTAYKKGSVLKMHGKEYTRNHDFYLTTASRPAIRKWLDELGAVHAVRKTGEKTQSHYKEVPWSILQADEKSQLSFLAAYLDCDGSICLNGNTLSFGSVSGTLLTQIHIMLSSLGYVSRKQKSAVVLYGKDSANLYEQLKPYLTIKHTNGYKPTGFRKFCGFPADAFTSIVRNAIIKRDTSGTTIRLQNGNIERVPSLLYLNAKAFLYDMYDAGNYDDFLLLLKKVDQLSYENILKLFKLRYDFTPVVNIRDSGIKDVYDLSMKPGAEPSYNANCIVGHNTADSSLTMFVEMLRSYRDMMTRKFFYERVFPLVSMVHGYTVNSKGKVSIREEVKNVSSVAEALKLMNDGSKLLIPTVTWAKTLKPEGDTSYMDLLKTLTEIGLPVPLRVLAAAGGLNLDELFRQKDDDLALRKQIKTYNDALKEFAPPAPEEGMSESRSLVLPPLRSKSGASAVLQPTGGHRPPLLTREFDQEVFGVTKTGKKKMMSPEAQRESNNKVNKLIVTAMKTNEAIDRVRPTTHKVDSKSSF